MVMRPLGTALLLIAVVYGPTCRCADDSWNGRRIEALAEQLRADEYVRREDASRMLADAPASALPILERLAQETDDPEARLRLQQAAHAIFVNQVAQRLPEWPQGRGFLGIRWTISGDAAGVVINEVLADTAADRSGLQAGDLILSANGRSFEEGMTQEEAMLIWREMLPGDHMKLKVRKAGQQEATDMEVVVGGMPDEYRAELSEGEKIEKLWARYLQGRLKLPENSPLKRTRLQSWLLILQAPAK